MIHAAMLPWKNLMVKEEWISEKISDLMYEDETLGYTEALEIAERLWQELGVDEL